MILILYFILGTFVGSFLNAYLYRMYAQKSVLFGRSFCVKCNHKLSWNDLIPIFSFILLQGKCRYCSRVISIQYPIIEFVTGCLFVFSAFIAPSTLSLIFYWIISSLLVFIFVYDFRHSIIPDVIVYSAIAISILHRLFNGDLVLALISGILFSLFFLLIFLISKGKWMGFGDVKLALLMGIVLSFPSILVAFFMSFFVGGIVGAVLIIKKKKGMRSEIPFAPFLVLGTFIALFFGELIIDWYMSFLLL